MKNVAKDYKEVKIGGGVARSLFFTSTNSDRCAALSGSQEKHCLTIYSQVRSALYPQRSNDKTESEGKKIWTKSVLQDEMDSFIYCVAKIE